MSEPTKEAIEEAEALVVKFGGYLGHTYGEPHISLVGLANLIAHVRKQARDDAAQSCHEIMMQQRAQAGDFDEWEHGKADGAQLCRDALKTQGDAQ